MADYAIPFRLAQYRYDNAEPPCDCGECAGCAVRADDDGADDVDMQLDMMGGL